MTQEQAKLIRQRLLRGHQSLEEARLLLDQNYLYGCVNWRIHKVTEPYPPFR